MASSRRLPAVPSHRSSSHTNVGIAERAASAAGGAALLATAMKKGGVGGTVLALAGGALVARGLSGYCPVNDAIGRDSSRDNEPLELKTALTVQAARRDVYNYWRRLENLPRFMEHLTDVRSIDNERSHWSAEIPGVHTQLEWDAEIVADDDGRRVAWQSLPGGDIENAGDVEFRDAPGGRGTEVIVDIRYRPPAGAVGRTVARALGPVFRQLVTEDVRRFKQVMEAGERPTIAGQPSARRVTAPSAAHSHA